MIESAEFEHEAGIKAQQVMLWSFIQPGEQTHRKVSRHTSRIYTGRWRVIWYGVNVGRDSFIHHSRSDIKAIVHESQSHAVASPWFRAVVWQDVFILNCGEITSMVCCFYKTAVMAVIETIRWQLLYIIAFWYVTLVFKVWSLEWDFVFPWN